MLVINPSAFSRVMQALVEATHGMTDLGGAKHMPRTVDEITLRNAALGALVNVTGHVVWPGDQQLRIPKPKPQPGAVQIEE